MSIARVQTVSNDNGTGASTVSATWGSATTAGSLLVAEVSVLGDATATISAPSGWTAGPKVADASANQCVAMFYIVNAASRSGAESFGGLGGTKCAGITLTEYSGVDTSAPLDVSHTNSSATNVATADTGATAATASGEELWLAVVCNKNSNTTQGTPSSGWSIVNQRTTTNATAASNVTHGAYEQIVASTGNAAAQMTVPLVSANRTYAAAIITFKAAAAGSAPSGGSCTLTESSFQTVGTVLHASTSGWSGSPTSYRFEFLRDGVAISGSGDSGFTASASFTYTLASGDDGHTISVRVTARNGIGDSSAVTASNTVSAGTAPSGGTPSISGTTQVSQTLTAATGTWSGTPTLSYTYQWRRNGTNIGGATASTYVLTLADLGATITVKVTATNSWGSANNVSAGVGPISAAPVSLGASQPTSTSLQTTTALQTGQGNGWLVYCEAAFASPLDTQAARIQWTDITLYLRSFAVKRGRQNELQRFEAGTADLVLDNTDDRFTPTNAASPYSPNVLPVRRIRLYAQWAGGTYPLFSGFVESWPPDYPSMVDAVVRVTASDAFKIANLAKLVSEPLPQALTGDRLVQILTEQTPQIPRTSISQGLSECAADTIDAALLAHAQEIETTEYGQLYVDAAGGLVFRDRYWRYFNSQTAVAVLGEQTNEIPYVAISPSFDDANLWNEAVVTPKVGDPVTIGDATSQAAYGRRTVSVNVLSPDQSFAVDLAGHLLGVYKDPKLRFDQVALDSGSPSSNLAQQLAFHIGDRVTVKRRHGSVTVTQDAYIEAIQHTGTPTGPNTGGLRTTLQLSPAPIGESFWVVGDAVSGVLDSTTTLGY